MVVAATTLASLHREVETQLILSLHPCLRPPLVVVDLPKTQQQQLSLEQAINKKRVHAHKPESLFFNL